LRLWLIVALLVEIAFSDLETEIDGELGVIRDLVSFRFLVIRSWIRCSYKDELA